MGRERSFPSKANPGVMGERGTVLRQFLPLLCHGPSPPHAFLLPLVSSRPSLLILAPAGDLGGQKEPLRAVSLWLRWTHAQGHGPLWTPAVPHSSWLALSPTCCRQEAMLRRGHLPALPPWQLPSDHSHLPISISAAAQSGSESSVPCTWQHS